MNNFIILAARAFSSIFAFLMARYIVDNSDNINADIIYFIWGATAILSGDIAEYHLNDILR